MKNKFIILTAIFISFIFIVGCIIIFFFVSFGRIEVSPTKLDSYEIINIDNERYVFIKCKELYALKNDFVLYDLNYSDSKYKINIDQIWRFPSPQYDNCSVAASPNILIPESKLKHGETIVTTNRWKDELLIIIKENDLLKLKEVI